jgi:hypothetical protein
MSSNDQINLFEMKEWWESEWQDMPEFVQEDHMPWRTIKVHFKNEQDFEKFQKAINQKITAKRLYTWFPEVENFKACNFRYVDTDES